MKKLLYILFVALFVVACANIASPDGGPFDEDPPKVVRTTPKYGAINTSTKKIVLEFNENVKIENATENVIISPPQIEQPEIEAVGKKITIKLIDSIKPNTTYTIDFADAIKDNNEGNPLGDYAFTFSSGGEIDTMQVSGNILDASNLEPIKGMMVGVYAIEEGVEDVPDSIFRTKPLERVSRTDANGHFVIKGLKNCQYRVFALNDQNQNFMYDQKSEMIGFTSKRFEPTCKPDVQPDTIWHDSIHYDSIIYRGYTHFYPDDITLTAFTVSVQDRFLLKNERPQLNKFTLLFSAGSDTLPKITGLNFDAENAFVIDASEKNDTLNYWIRDSLIYNIDTLQMQLDYYATDTTGQLALMVDTLILASKISKAKMAKDKEKAFEEWAKKYRKEYKAEMKAKEREAELESEADGADEDENSEADDSDKPKKEDRKSKADDKKKKKKLKDEDILVPPMPEEFMELKVDPNSLDPDKNILITLPEPVDSVDLSKLRFFTKRDSIEVDAPHIFQKVEGKVLQYELLAEWQPDSTYFLVCDTGMFVNIYGKRSVEINKSIKVGSMDTYSTLFVELQNADTSAIVQLLDPSDKVVKTVESENGKADFYYIRPGKYYLRMFYDRNGNGVWDSGDYDKQLQPEEVFYYSKVMELKAQWEITEHFNPTSVPLAKQKPLAITKQKDSRKDKSKKSKNQQRLEEKMQKKNGVSNNNSNAMSGMRF